MTHKLKLLLLLSSMTPRTTGVGVAPWLLLLLIATVCSSEQAARRLKQQPAALRHVSNVCQHTDRSYLLYNSFCAGASAEPPKILLMWMSPAGSMPGL